MVPILVAVVVLIALGVLGVLWLKSTGRSVFWFSDQGFRAVSFHQPIPPRQVTPEEVKRVIQALLNEEEFDCLSICADPEGRGVSFDSIHEELRLSVQLLVSKEIEHKDPIIRAMADLGLETVIKHPWNVDMGPDLEMLSVSFPIPADADLMYRATETVLQILSGEASPERYLEATNLKDFPADASGLKLVPRSDPLDAILGSREG